MHFKLIVVIADDDLTDSLVEVARASGATGATVVGSTRGEGLQPAKSFFGLALEERRDMIFMLVEEHLCRHILETIGEAGQFDTRPGRGIAFQLDVEDAVGIGPQVRTLQPIIEEEL
ncbi:MAG: P-II family nitrogen regulator [Arachnia sp.]